MTMAEIVNLRTLRKRKARVEKDRRAEENLRLHGRKNIEVQGTKAEKMSLSRRLDQHLREKNEDERE